MKNNVDRMRENPVKKHIQDKAQKWKALQKKNVLALTEIYEREQCNFQKLEARYAIATK